jgi:hypothetical protein
MMRRIVFVLTTFFIAFGILVTSVIKSAQLDYAFTGSVSAQERPQDRSEIEDLEIDYVLRYQGSVLPDHPLWPVKALRDWLWLFITRGTSGKAELMLLFSDKRLASSKILFERDKPELAYSTLTKAEKYLEGASGLNTQNTQKGVDTVAFSTKLANASLKHREVIEKEILPIAPEDAKPGIVKTLDYPNKVFQDAQDTLNSKGVTPPENPFGRQ